MKRIIRYLPIRVKFILPMIAALTLMLIFVNFYIHGRYKQFLLKSYIKEASKTAELFSVAVTFALEQHNFQLLVTTLQNAKFDRDIYFILLFDEHNNQIAAFNPYQLPSPDITSLGNITYALDEKLLFVKRSISFRHSPNSGILLIGYNLRDLFQQIHQYRVATIAFTIISFFLGLMVIHQISKRITRSVSQLHQQMQAIIKKGEYLGKVQLTSHDEIGRLGEAFNQMMEEIRIRHEKLVESQKRYRKVNKKLQKLNRLKTIFVSDASHHLRTPLTIIRGEVEVALMRQRSRKEYQDVLKIINDETINLIHIVENLLTLAKADTGKLLSLENTVDFSTVCINQVQHGNVLAKKEGVKLEKKIQENCFIYGDPVRLAEMTFTLIENAITYTPKGNRVLVTLEQDKKGVLLKIADTGIGIPEKEIDLVFNRFYRATNSRKVSIGTGLGLSICKNIVEAHGGSIHVSSVLGKGTTFEIRFPPLKARPQQKTNSVSMMTNEG